MNNIAGDAHTQACALTLEELLRSVPWLPPGEVQSQADSSEFLIRLPLPGGGQATLLVECKRELRPSHFPLLLEPYRAASARLEAAGPWIVPVLAMPWVSPRMAELCVQSGWSWFDLAGNHSLDIPGLLRLQRSGLESTVKAPRPGAQLGSGATGRVIVALLLPDHAGRLWTQRELQKQAQVSLGLVNKVIRHLRDEAFIVEDKDGGFRLLEPLKLLFAWRDAYRFKRHRRLGYFTLLQGEKLRHALASLADSTQGHALYSVFSAAEQQAPHVRQNKTWLYLREQDLPNLELLAEAKRVDSGDNLVILIPHDDGVFFPADRGGSEGLACTNLVQTYVDLYHSGGRGAEAAEALLEQRLKPEWQRGANR
jgi:Transcriptional regulator, AbiEi antitoxin, Type IV TA system